ncbi:MAG: molybdenum cofactor biosynthesis protein MoaE [Chloroflexota bacterium]|nr:molybdenum cofactor biosynthesis protein MoaE [Chloroflexota bacterium]
MRVHVRFFAALRDVAGDRFELDVADDAGVVDVWSACVARVPALSPHAEFVRPARNAAYVGWDDSVADGDEVAFLPPVSGGASTVALTNGGIEVADLEAVAGTGHGAVVTFIGRARDTADDGRTVVELEYEAYDEMALAVLESIVREAETRWRGTRVAVTHRTGVVPIGEVAVAIVAAAVHRGEAYEASRYVIEEIKTRLPVWKRERFADGTEWKRHGA